MEHYLYENFSDLSASYEYSRLCGNHIRTTFD